LLAGSDVATAQGETERMTASGIPEADTDPYSGLALVPVPVLLLDADGTLRYRNDAAADLLASCIGLDGNVGTSLLCAFPWLCADLGELSRGAVGGSRSVAFEGGVRTFIASYRQLDSGSPIDGFALLTLVETTASQPATALDPIREALRGEDLLRTARVLIVSTDRNGAVTTLNEAAERATGCSAREMVGQNWFDEWILPTRSTLEQQVLANVARDGYFGPYTCRIRVRDGDTRSISWRTSALREGEELVGTVSVGWDVTEHSATQDRLRESEERHRTLLASLPQRIFVKDQQGVFVSVNDAFAGDFGRKAADFVGKTDFDLFAPELAVKYREDDRRVIETRQTETIVEGNVTQGRPRHVEVVKAPVVTDDGNVLGVVGVFTDITERKLIEQELARERDLLHILMDHIPDQIFFKDRESRFTRVNRAAANALGVDEPSQAVGLTDGDLHPEDLANEYLADEQRLIAAGVPLVGKLEAQRSADGREYWLSTTKVPIRDGDGQVIGIAGISRDVSDRIQVEEELRETAAELARSNEELQQFAYVASHDLQEPLRMVASYTQLLARRYQDRLDQDGLDFINYAVDGATRMQGLIQDLLAYSRVGTRAGMFEPIDLSAAMDRALANLHAAVGESEAKITRGALPTVQGDLVQLTQLFQNLLGNAIKFRGSEPCRIHVSARRAGREWEISVTDNGIGIEPEYTERIFVIFQRLHGKGDYPGTGIGLAICKKIAARHGGRIWVESQFGKGSTVYFTIPARLSEHPEARPESSAKPRLSEGGPS